MFALFVSPGKEKLEHNLAPQDMVHPGFQGRVSHWLGAHPVVLVQADWPGSPRIFLSLHLQQWGNKCVPPPGAFSMWFWGLDSVRPAAWQALLTK